MRPFCYGCCPKLFEGNFEVVIRTTQTVFFSTKHICVDCAPKGARVDRVDRCGVSDFASNRAWGVYFITQKPVPASRSILWPVGERIPACPARPYRRDAKPAPRAQPTRQTAFLSRRSESRSVGEESRRCCRKRGYPVLSERTLIRPPVRSQLGPLDPAIADALIGASPMAREIRHPLDAPRLSKLLAKTGRGRREEAGTGEEPSRSRRHIASLARIQHAGAALCWQTGDTITAKNAARSQMTALGGAIAKAW